MDREEAALWKEVDTKFRARTAFMNVVGDTDTGRSHFALTAPGPIAYLHCAEKVAGLIHRVRARGVLIREHNFGGVFRGTEEQIAKQAAPVWQAFRKAYISGLKWAGTVIVDTDTDAWELIRLAAFGGQKPQKGRVDTNYGPLNAEFRSLASRYRAQNACNVIMISKTRDEYKTGPGGRSDGMGERTGNTIRAGMKDIPFLCDVGVRTSRGQRRSKKTGNMLTEYKVTIEKPWFNGEARDLEFTNKDATFAMVMSEITGTSPEEWSRTRVVKVGGVAG